MVTVTKHARERLKQRNGLQKKSIDRIVQKVYDEGLKHSETKGALNKWLTEVYMKHETANELRVYGDILYVFRKEKLITEFPLPTEIKLKLNSYSKRRNEDGNKNNNK